MIKLKWFIVASITLCIMTTGVLYWHYHVLNHTLKQFLEVQYIFNRPKETALAQRIKNSLADRESILEITEDEKLAENLEIARSIYDLEEALRDKIFEIENRLYRQIPLHQRQELVFTIHGSNQFLIASDRVTELWHAYQDYLKALKKRCPTITYHELFSFEKISLQDFEAQFRDVPLPISTALLQQLSFDVLLKAKQAIKWTYQQYSFPHKPLYFIHL